MISIPSFILLVPYGLFLFAVLFMTLLNIKHLFHTGTTTLVSFSFTLFFFFYLFGVLFLTFSLLSGFDWKEPLVTLTDFWSKSSGQYGI